MPYLTMNLMKGELKDSKRLRRLSHTSPSESHEGRIERVLEGWNDDVQYPQNLMKGELKADVDCRHC